MVHWHREVLIASGLILILAFVLEVRPDERVAIRGLSRFPLPSVCASRNWLGVKCPACGLTRSLVRLAAGNLDASLSAHRLGWVMAVVLVLQFPFRLIAMRTPERPLISAATEVLLACALVAVFIGNYLIELAMGKPV